VRNSISKTIVAGLAALAMSAATVTLPATPASAAWGGNWHGGGMGGGWHGGGWGGGWHGGGWNGGWRGGGWNGGWRGGGWGWRGAGWNGGWGGWRGGWGWNRGWGWGGCGWGNCGGWWGPAFASGVAIGAVGSYPYWGGYYGYPSSGCWVSRPTYNRWGRYLGRRWVSVC
jgi:hypothetical protein